MIQKQMLYDQNHVPRGFSVLLFKVMVAGQEKAQVRVTSHQNLGYLSACDLGTKMEP